MTNGITIPTKKLIVAFTVGCNKILTTQKIKFQKCYQFIIAKYRVMFDSVFDFSQTVQMYCFFIESSVVLHSVSV